MASMNDVPTNDLIEKAAEGLKKIDSIKPPEWAAFVKTGAHKERPPARDDWWYVRSAAILRSTVKLGPVGVSKLRTKYGGKKNRGYAPDRFAKGSGNIIRKILQQLEKAQLVVQADKSGRKGRVIAPKGVSLLNKAAQEASAGMTTQSEKDTAEQESKAKEEQKPQQEKEEKSRKAEKTQADDKGQKEDKGSKDNPEKDKVTKDNKDEKQSSK